MGRLVLWDIDRTLVDIGGISREIYAAAYAEVTGQPLVHMPRLAGRTDHDLILDSLAMHGVPAPERYVEPFYDALTAATRLRRADIERHGRALPGAREAIDALAAIPGLVQTVVTGNVRPVAELKLQAFGLAGPIDFDIGGYGSDDSDRAHLVRMALERAHRKHGTPTPTDHAVVIGDTPHDIAGAHANGIRAIAVATGTFPAETLTAAEAVLTSLQDTGALLHLVLESLHP